jgi:stage IV sporulation protein A
MDLEEPELVRRGGQFGVKLRARASSWHIMRVDLDTEVTPVVGSEQQGESMLQSLVRDFESDPESIWQTEFFGRSLQSMVGEGISQKIHSVPPDVQEKLRSTVNRIVNGGSSGGLLVVLL